MRVVQESGKGLFLVSCNKVASTGQYNVDAGVPVDDSGKRVLVPGTGCERKSFLTSGIRFSAKRGIHVELVIMGVDQFRLETIPPSFARLWVIQRAQKAPEESALIST